MSKEIQPFAARVWLKAAAEYFESRPSAGEDQEHWASVYNAENARTIADLIERQSKMIADMLPYVEHVSTRSRAPFNLFRDAEDVISRARALSQEGGE